MDSQPDLQTYVLLQHLPTVSECVQTIINIAPSYSTKMQMEAVHIFASSLCELWVKSFTDVITLKYIKLNLTEHLKVYASKVSKAKGNMEQNITISLADNHKLMDILKKNPLTLVYLTKMRRISTLISSPLPENLP